VTGGVRTQRDAVHHGGDDETREAANLPEQAVHHRAEMENHSMSL